jgi:hypothetical protein
MVSEPMDPPIITSDDPLNTSSASPQVHTDPIIILNLPISTKLTKNNYLAWQSKIIPLLHGHGLYEFISTSSPNLTSVGTNGLPKLNPDYLNWHK